MFNQAPVAFISSQHLSKADVHLSMNCFDETKSIFDVDLGLYFYDLAGYLLVDMNSIDSLNDVISDMKSHGFTRNFIQILYDAYRRDYLYVMFHVDAPINSHYHVYQSDPMIFQDYI